MNKEALIASIAEAKPSPTKTRTSKKVTPANALERFEGMFGDTKVLAFDQALTNTGFVKIASGCLAGYPNQPLRLDTRAHYKYQATPGEPQGALLSLRKTAALARWMEAVLRAHGDIRTVVYEMPVVAGHRTESILMGAYALFEACRNTNRPEPIAVNNQHAKSIIIGRSRGVTKAEVKANVNDYLPDWMRAGTGPWNEHVIDATLLGMAWLYETQGYGEA